jgi:hypothetical protein
MSQAHSISQKADRGGLRHAREMQRPKLLSNTIDATSNCSCIIHLHDTTVYAASIPCLSFHQFPELPLCHSGDAAQQHEAFNLHSPAACSMFQINGSAGSSAAAAQLRARVCCSVLLRGLQVLADASRRAKYTALEYGCRPHPSGIPIRLVLKRHFVCDILCKILPFYWQDT